MAKKGKKTTAADGFIEQRQTMTFAEFVKFLPQEYRGEMSSHDGRSRHVKQPGLLEFTCAVKALQYFVGSKSDREVTGSLIHGDLSTVDVVAREQRDAQGRLAQRQLVVEQRALRFGKSGRYLSGASHADIPVALTQQFDRDGQCTSITVRTQRHELTYQPQEGQQTFAMANTRELDHAERMATRGMPADTIDWRSWAVIARQESRSWSGFRRSGTNRWDIWEDRAFQSPLWEEPALEVAQTINKYGEDSTNLNPFGVNFYKDLEQARIAAVPPVIDLVRDIPTAKPYVLESQDRGAVYLWGNEQGEIARRITALQDGRICDESFSGNKPALMIVYDPQKQVVSETRFTADGVSHQVTRHAYGEEHIHLKNGKPHNLAGAWRHGVDVQGREIAPQYCIEGRRYSAMTYFANPIVTAQRPPLLQSFAAATRRLLGSDAPAIALNAPQDALSGLHGRYAAARLDWILNAQGDDVRRDIIAKLAASFYDHPAAADLRAQRGDEVVKLARHAVASDVLVQAASDADTYAQQLAQQRDSIAKTPLARDYFDSMILRIEDEKQKHASLLERAAAKPDAQAQAALTQAEAVVALVTEGVLSGHQPAGAREVLETLQRHHAALPNLDAKVAGMQTAADQLRGVVDGLKTELREGLSVARTEIQTVERFIEMQSDDVFSQAVSAPAKPAKLDRWAMF